MSSDSTEQTMSTRQFYTKRATAAYRGGELGRLGRLSTLLPNWRQWGVQSGDIVGGEAAVEVPAGIAGGRGRTHLGADAAQRTRDGSER